MISKENYETVLADLEKQEVIEEEYYYKYPYNEDLDEKPVEEI
jgi:hypothetical protein